MKKFFCAFLVVLSLISLGMPELAADDELTVSINDLVVEADVNLLRFNKNYLGKTLTVSDCIVEQVTGTSNTEVYILTVKASRSKPFVSNKMDCKFSGSELEKLADLNPGDVVTVKGVYSTQKRFGLDNIELENCELK